MGWGSTRELTDASGNVTDRYVYDAFGNTIGQVGSTVNLYLFAGEHRDQEIGLDYLECAVLECGDGRFTNSRSGRRRFVLAEVIAAVFVRGKQSCKRRRSQRHVHVEELSATTAILSIVSSIAIGAVALGGTVGHITDLDAWDFGGALKESLRDCPRKSAMTLRKTIRAGGGVTLAASVCRHQSDFERPELGFSFMGQRIQLQSN